MLCGWDPLTRRSYEHCKFWLQQRLVFLASVMAIDLDGFCTMGNHRHLIVRNRPDGTAKWSAEEIARKGTQQWTAPLEMPSGGTWGQAPAKMFVALGSRLP